MTEYPPDDSAFWDDLNADLRGRRFRWFYRLATLRVRLLDRLHR